FTLPSPYLSIALAVLLIAPHIWWLITTGFMPFHYVAGETGHSTLFSLGQAARVLIGAALALSAVLWLVLRPGSFSLTPIKQDPPIAMLASLAVLPFTLTLIAATPIGLVLSDNTAGATFAFVPLLLLQLTEQQDWRPVSRLAIRIATACA